MKYVFDIDGTICAKKDGEGYDKSPSSNTKRGANSQNQLLNQKLVAADSYSGVRLQTARPKRLVQQPDYYRHPQKVVVNVE